MAVEYAPTPVEDFLDPDDPAMFPRLTPEQVDYLAGIGAQQTFARGDEVFGHGQRETPLNIVESGAVDIIDHAPEGDRYFTQCQEATLIGDLSMFTGEPTLAAGYAAGPTSLIALPPEDVRRVVATAPAELGGSSCGQWRASPAWPTAVRRGRARGRHPRPSRPGSARTHAALLPPRPERLPPSHPRFRRRRPPRWGTSPGSPSLHSVDPRRLEGINRHRLLVPFARQGHFDVQGRPR